MAEAAAAFLDAAGRLPRERFPLTHGVRGALDRLGGALRTRLPPHLHPLVARLQAACVRQALAVESRVQLNPAFRLLLSTRLVPPALAFGVAAVSTAYALRYLYAHALDLLTNLVGVAYPAYQSILCIEYGELPPECVHAPEFSTAAGQPLDRALGLAGPNLDKKQWLTYWAIFGLLTTADHWAGPILRLFPMYRLAKIGVLIWAQHRRYNGAAWLYDTLVRPLLPPPSSLAPQPQPQTPRLQDPADADLRKDAAPFSTPVMTSVWASAAAPEQ
ncbi:hypothetical protein H4R18_002026 [Coemansia javaensis]|uniref:Protein YOP1 n=1 Tax=Coemansia javaensis TaxID=2761396 RepID=A0A9W8HAY3_9FUNG|nr:hypothetical protein H4R18_002026 [Coemansia javaensis]